MFKNETRKGLSLGAIVSLVAALFVSAPAQAAGELTIVPNGGTSLEGLITEKFELDTYYTAPNAAGYADLSYVIEKPAGYMLDIEADATSGFSGTSGGFEGATYRMSASDTISPVITTATSAGQNFLTLLAASASGITSVSPKLAVKVTAFLDSSPRDGKLSAGDWQQTVTVNLNPHSAIADTLAIVAPYAGASKFTVSATATGINFTQLGGRFYAVVNNSGEGFSTASAAITGTSLAGGNWSASFDVASVSEGVTFSAALHYSADTTINIVDGERLSATVSQAVQAANIVGLTFSPVVGSNLIVGSTAAAGTSRINNPFTIHAYGYTGSSTVVTSAVNNYAVVSSRALSETVHVTINGVKYTQSALLPDALNLPAGKAAIAVSPVGFTADDTLTFTLNGQGKSAATYTVTLKTPTWTIKNEDVSDYAVVGAGVATTYNFSVEDQFKVKSNRVNQRLSAVTSGTGFSTSDPVLATVASGLASVAIATSPAAKTGSATLTVTLQTQDIDSGNWSDGDTHTVNLTVTTGGTTTGLSTSPAASTSGSISYIATTGISYSAISGISTKEAGATVTVAGDNLIIKSGTNTASGSLTFRAGASGAVSLELASEKAGTHTFSITVGTSVTTSQFVVEAATASAGASMTFDTSNIKPGATARITGTLVDANGNPVDTTVGSATILVTYVGAGIPIGTMPTETDADGEFSFTVLAGSADSGTAVVTAVYAKSGASTAAKDKVTATQQVTIGAVAAVADQKITVGTFKGYVAIYTKGYMGQKLSAKVAGKWLVVDPIAAYKSNDYSRTVRLTGAGYTITVDLYIDGAFVRSEVVTTK